MFEAFSNSETFTGGQGQRITHGYCFIHGLRYGWRFEVDNVTNESSVESYIQTADKLNIVKHRNIRL